MEEASSTFQAVRARTRPRPAVPAIGSASAEQWETLSSEMEDVSTTFQNFGDHTPPRPTMQAIESASEDLWEKPFSEMEEESAAFQSVRARTQPRPAAQAALGSASESADEWETCSSDMEEEVSVTYQDIRGHTQPRPATATAAIGSASAVRSGQNRTPFEHTITADEIPAQFAQWGEEFSWIHSMIECGMYLRCNVTRSIHPTKFHVQLHETFEESDRFDDKLQMWVNRYFIRNHQLKPNFVPKMACIQPGLYILCKHDFSWHRARVLSLENNEKFQVELIDSGFEITADMQDISYILRDMMTALKPQAIQCRLRFDPPFDSYLVSAKKLFREEIWSTAAKTELQTLLYDNQLGITFHEFNIKHNNRYGVNSGIWTVSINCLIPGEFKLQKIEPCEESVELDDGTGSDSSMEVEVGGDAQSVFPDGSLAKQVLIYDISTMFTKYIPHPPPSNPKHPGFQQFLKNLKA